MNKQSSSSNHTTDNSAVVDGHHISGKQKKSKKKLLFVALFALFGAAGIFFASAATTTTSLFSNADVPKTLSTRETRSIEVGVKFKSSKVGRVTGVKFYKGAQNTGTHTGTLWDSKGTRLATVTFTNETASGWQTANFPQPVNIASDVTYIISYHAPNGHYSETRNYFDKARTNGPLTAPHNTKTNRNAVYVFSSSTTFPTNGFQASNFWVDVIVETDLIGTTVAPAPPSQVTAVQEGNSVVVNWNEGTSSTTISKYRIYKNDAYLMAVGTDPRTFIDTNVQAGQTYTYQIKTVDVNDVASVRSIAASVTFNLTPPPTCPEGQTGTPPNCVTPPVVTTGYPDATNTGVKAGITRTNSGSINSSSDGQVIQNLNINGSMYISHNNVTVRNVKFTNPGGPAILIDPNKSGTLIEDCEMDGSGNSGAEGAVGWARYTIRRCNIHHFGEGFSANGGTVIEDNYLHDFTNWISSGAHQDGIQVEYAGGDVIRHNTILMNVDGANATIHVSGNPGAALVENNLLGSTGGKDISAAYGTWRNNKITDRIRVSGALSRIFEYGFPHTICGTTFYDGPNAGQPVEGDGPC